VKTEIIGIQSQASFNGRHEDRMESGNGSGVQINNDPLEANGNGSDTAPIYSRAVERYALYFDHPEARLRFVNNTLNKQADRQHRLQRRFRRFRVLEGTRIYDRVVEARCYSAIFEEMRDMRSFLPKDRRRHMPLRIQAPFYARLAFLLHEARHAVYGAALFSSVLAFFALYSFGLWSARWLNNFLANTSVGSRAIASTPVPTPAPTPNRNNDIFKMKEKIFYYGKEGEYEKWSNGCTISTKYETDNHPRAYYTLQRGLDNDGDQVSHKIVGILYHTPESYMIEFNEENNKAIQKGSRGLLEHVQKHKKYNYMINRIGDIYRIVRDEQTAYHAGDSLWADEKNTYVLLNESFIGVCFESKFEGASSLEDILTPAQIRSGKLLTDVLRTRYSIDDANCTTHGLVAVDPDKMLIARHHDWVRYFPFEQMGLSDKYKVLPPNMTDYGFTVDQDVMAKLGNNLWDGAKTAEGEFKRRAERIGLAPDDMRNKMRDRYILQRNKVLGLHPESSNADNARLGKKPSGAMTTESGASQSNSDAWKAIN
jgi:N-acetyl-anhydromuramyl-L-alanine amidase AmpD